MGYCGRATDDIARWHLPVCAILEEAGDLRGESYVIGDSEVFFRV